jgi:hypothetical protein
MNAIPAHMISEETILDVLRRVAALEAEVASLRAEVASLRAERQPEPEQPAPPDLSDEYLIELGEAAHCYGVSKNLLQKWCRRSQIGVKKFGRWYISVNRLEAHISR